MIGSMINCRYCGGPRMVNGKSCSGCGMAVANARVATSKKRKRHWMCPVCSSPHSRALDNHRRICVRCGTEYERPDFHFVDDRPEHNAMKKGL